MSTFVLVHGSWGGGWQWRKVADQLRVAGHAVTTPTLTGLGERAHVHVSEPITLGTHIQDLVEHLFFEDLTDVVLVGWSGGSAIVEAVADTVPERVKVVVDLDGHLVAEGELLDGMEPDEIDAIRSSDWIPAPTADDLADTLDDEGLRQHVAARERPHPSATWTARYPDLGGRRRQLRHVYVACLEPPKGQQWTTQDLAPLERVKSDPAWEVVELPLNHLGLLYAPQVVADALLRIIAQE
jgi:pimeloyl-ACP methyl ester carboxylesterase